MYRNGIVETRLKRELAFADVIDWILDNLVERQRTRRGVIAKLKELGLVFKAPTKRSAKQRATAKAEDLGDELNSETTSGTSYYCSFITFT